MKLSNQIAIDRMLMELSYNMPLSNPFLPLVYKRYLRILNNQKTITINFKLYSEEN